MIYILWLYPSQLKKIRADDERIVLRTDGFYREVVDFTKNGWFVPRMGVFLSKTGSYVSGRVIMISPTYLCLKLSTHVCSTNGSIVRDDTWSGAMLRVIIPMYFKICAHFNFFRVD